MVETLASSVIHEARELGLTIATAESLTGGLVSAGLVNTPGASDVFVGGVVAYHSELKHTLLGVESEILDEHGPVDSRVAEQMALGARTACMTHRRGDAHPVHPDLGVATTGVAGPDPDPQTGQAPGAVWIGVSSKLGERSGEFQFTGDRDSVRNEAARAAFEMLRDELERLRQ